MAVSSANRTNTHGISVGAKLRGETHPARRNVRHNFLNAHFESIPGYRIAANEAAVAFGSPENDIARLRGEVEVFCKKYHVQDSLPEVTGNYLCDVNNLFKFLKEHLPEDWCAECVQESGNDSPLKFVVYRLHKDFPEYTVWSLPIGKLDSVDEKTRKLLLTTFAMLHRKDVYTYPKDNYDMQYILGVCEYGWGETDEEGNLRFDEQAEFWDEEYKKWVESYIAGDINELFNEIECIEQGEKDGEGPISRKLTDLIAQYRKEKYHNPRLLDIIEQLVELCDENWLSDFHLAMIRNEFGDDFASEEDASSELMDFSRLFFFVYDTDDPICQSMVNMFNQDAYNLEVGNMYSYSFIDSENIEERMSETFPERWADVHSKFINELLS